MLKLPLSTKLATVILIKVKSCNALLRMLLGRNSEVGITTRYGLDGPGIESRWGGEIFRIRPDRPWGSSTLLYNGYRVFPGGKAAGEWR